jgi:hypothetical protein
MTILNLPIVNHIRSNTINVCIPEMRPRTLPRRLPKNVWFCQQCFYFIDDVQIQSIVADVQCRCGSAISSYSNRPGLYEVLLARLEEGK